MTGPPQSTPPPAKSSAAPWTSTSRVSWSARAAHGDWPTARPSSNSDNATPPGASDRTGPFARTEPDAKVLVVDEHQPHLERHHAQLKGVQLVAPAYSKHVARIEGLSCCHSVALLVQALVERATPGGHGRRRRRVDPPLPRGPRPWSTQRATDLRDLQRPRSPPAHRCRPGRAGLRPSGAAFRRV